MQLILNSSQLLNEAQIVLYMHVIEDIQIEYKSALRKERRGKELTEWDKTNFESVESFKTELNKKGFSKNHPYNKITPFYFAQMIIGNMMYGIMKLKDIIMKYEIDRVFVFFHEDPFPIWGKEMKYILSKDFIPVLTQELNELKNEPEGEWDTYAYDMDSVMEIYYYQLYSHLKSAKEEKSKRLDWLRNMNSIMRDRKKFEVIDLTETEKKKILNITFESFCDSKSKKFDDITKSQDDPAYYLVTDLQDLDYIEFLSKLNNIYGVSMPPDTIYSNDLVRINKLVLTNEFLLQSAESYAYQLDFLSALDEKFQMKLNQIIDQNKEARYFFINSANDFVKHRIINYCNKRTGAEFCELSQRELETKISKSNNLLIINNFEDMPISSQNKIWSDLKKSVFNEGFVLFFVNHTPRSATVLADLDKANIWKYNNDEVKNNISKIFHSLLCECCKIELDKYTIEGIKRNSFESLIGMGEGNLDVLFRSIKCFSSKYVFDYTNCWSWYYLREDYRERIQYYEELIDQNLIKQGNSQNIFFHFDPEGDSWDIVGLSKKPIHAPNTKTLLYTILTIEFNKKYNNKGIRPHQLIILSNYYLYLLNKLDKNKLEELLEYEEDLKNNRSTIESALYFNLPKKTNPDFKRFLKKRIRFQSNKVVYREIVVDREIDSIYSEDNRIYNFNIEGFPFDYDLFSINYHELIKQKISSRA